MKRPKRPIASAAMLIERIIALMLIPIGVMTLHVSRENTDVLTQLRRMPTWLRIPMIACYCGLGAVILAGIGMAVGWLPR
jgi:predicted transporter